MASSRTVIIRMIADTKGFTGGVMGATKASQGLAGGLGKLNPALAGISGGALAAGAGIGLAAVAVGKSIGAWNSFDAKMTESLAIMGDITEMERKDMSDAAREVAKVTTFSAEQAAESYFFLASAGLDAKGSMEALPVVASFAQAGMFDMALATDLLTDAQSALGLTIRDDAVANMENMTKVGDVLVKANTLANASVQQFSEALTNKAGPAMRAAGIDIEEGVAVLAAFADQGIKGAEAGTQFGIVVRDLQTKALKNADAFKEMGIEVFDAQGNMNNMGEIIGDVEGALSGMSVEQAKSTLLMLGFSDKSVSALQALIGMSDQIGIYEDGLRSAGGVTEEIAEKQLKSFSNQMKLAGAALADAGLSIGEMFAPALEALVPIIRWMATAIGDLAKVVGPVLGLTFKVILAPLNALIEAGKGLAGVFSSGVRESNKFSVELEDLGAAVEKGADHSMAYEEALKGVIDKSSVTTDRLEELKGMVELTTKEQADAAAMALEYAKANDASSESVSSLTLELIQNADALYESGEMTMDEIEAVYGSGTAYEVAELARRRARQATEEGTEATGESADAVEEEIEVVTTLAERLAEAEAAQTSLSDVMRAAIDPVFAAMKAVENYQNATEDLIKVTKDSKSTQEDVARAELEQVAALLELQGKMDGMSTQDLEDAMRAVEAATGKSRAEVEKMFVALGILDGTTARTYVEFTTTSHNITVNELRNIGSAPKYVPEGRASGGSVVSDQMYLVGENGPEYFVPGRNGQVLTPTQLASSSNTKNVTVNFVNPSLANDPMEGLRAGFAWAGLEGQV